MRLLWLLILPALIAGCASAPRERAAATGAFADLVAEVDQLPPSPQKDRIRDLLAQLAPNLEAASAAVGSGLGGADVASLTQLGETTRPVAVDLGFATDGKDWSGNGIDNGVEVYLVPRDATKSAIKAPGWAEVTLSTESPLGLGLGGETLDSWTISAETLAQSWNEGLFPAYILRLPWNGRTPEVSSALLVVRFHPLYGQPLTARKTIEIRTVPPADAAAKAEAAPLPVTVQWKSPAYPASDRVARQTGGW